MNNTSSTKIMEWVGTIGLVVAVVALAIIIGVGFSGNTAKTIDLSWPNCGNLPKGNYDSAILGVNGGLDFRANPCLADEAHVASSYMLYVNTGNPGYPRIKQIGSGPLSCWHGQQLLCYSFNYGYQAAKYAMSQANIAGVHSAVWWLDVETVNSWTSSNEANRADLLGMMSALQSNLFSPKIGIYTATNQWKTIVGDWNISLPLWLGTGDVSLKQAINDCKQPSRPLLTQYTIGPLDYNYYCQTPTANNYFID